MKIPLMLELKGKNALVVGLGKVGLRRAKILSDYGCKVMCLGKKCGESLKEGKMIYIPSNYDIKYLMGMHLVVAATNKSEVNAQIVADCKDYGILVNAVDNPLLSDFIFPSVVKRGDLTLTVCTEGASPFLTTHIKDELAKKYDRSYERRLVLLRSLREHILTLSLSEEEKREKLKIYSELTIPELEKEMDYL